MSFTLNITKWLLKALFLGIFALIWIGYQATNAGYVDGLYVWDNAQRYTTSTEWKAWSSLFKALKWTMTDKAFADKYGKPIDTLLTEYLPTAPSDKKWLFQVLSALNKDLLDKTSWKTTQTQIQKQNNTVVEHNAPRPNNNNNNYNNSNGWVNYNNNYKQQWNSNVYDDDDPFGNAWSNNSNNSNNGGGFKSDLREQNDELINKTENWKRYTVEDLYKDMGSRPWLRKTAEHYYLWGSQWGYLRSSYERHIKLANINNKLFSDDASDDYKIEQIYNFVQNKVANGKNVDPWIPRKSPESAKWFAQHKEYVSAHNALDKWEAVCEGWNGLYFEMLMHAWLKNTSIEIQEWEVVGSVPWQEQWIWEGHYHVLLNGRASDAYAGEWGVYSAPYKIGVSGRGNRNFNMR